MLTLDNFESALPPRIVERGLDYFNDAAVEEITEKRPGVWSATVEGGASYSVDIRLAGRDVTATTCNCPYDGAVCKHIVAVLYALREETPKRRGGRRKAPKLHFEDMLQKVNLEELRDFVRHQHETNRDFGDVFKMYFADKDSAINVTDQYRTIIRKIIRNHSSRGFMDYRQSFGFSKEIQPFIQTAYTAVSRKNYRDAAIVGRALLIEVMPIIEACDDSAGNIGDIIAQGIQLLQEVAEADTVSPELQSQLFDFVESSLSDKTWFDYGDFGYEMLAVAECIALKLDQERYLRLLDNLLKIHVGKYSDYLQEHLKKLKIRFLFAIGRTADAEKLTAANMDIVEVRRSAVQQAIDVRDFSKAKQLVWEGIRIAEGKQHPGTVQQWEEKLFDIAKLQGDTGTARQLAKKFAFDRGLNPKYYQEWKMTYPPSEWQTVLESHIQSVVAEEQKRPRKGSWDREDHSLFQRLSPVFIIEEQWQRLLGLIPPDAGLNILLSIHPYLAKRFPKEMLALYLPALEREGDNASSRNHYRDLAMKMKKVKQDIEGSHLAVDTLARSLILKYPRRPAMVEEMTNGVLEARF